MLGRIHQFKNLKLKDFLTRQNILFLKDSLTNKGMTSFDKIFQQSTATHYQNIRSGSTFQPRKSDFKIEKYGRFLQWISAYRNGISYRIIQKQILNTLNVVNSKLLLPIISSNST